MVQGAGGPLKGTVQRDRDKKGTVQGEGEIKKGTVQGEGDNAKRRR